jgi:hypothetical protein
MYPLFSLCHLFTDQASWKSLALLHTPSPADPVPVDRPNPFHQGNSLRWPDSPYAEWKHQLSATTAHRPGHLPVWADYRHAQESRAERQHNPVPQSALSLPLTD